MRFKQLLTKTLLVVAGLYAGSMSAWADSETFGQAKDTGSKDVVITGTAVNIASGSNPSGKGSYTVFGVADEKGLKLRTSPSLTFEVKFGYRIKNITIKAYQNNKSTENHDMSCSGFSVDGTTYNFDTAKEIPYNSESTSTVPVEISTGKISATSSVAFNFANTNVKQNQIYAYITVEYEEACFTQNFTAVGESTDPTDYGFNLTYGAGSGPSLINFSVADGVLKCVAGPYASSSAGARTGTATATFDAIGAGNVITLNYKWALGSATGNTSGSYTKTKIGNSSGNALELSFYGSEDNGSLKVNGTTVKSGNSSIRNTTYTISATLDMNTKKITALTMTCSNADFSYSITEPIDFASAITSINRFAFENSERQSWANTSSVDDIVIHKQTYPAFNLSDTEKEFYVEDSETVTLTDITGDISVVSDNTGVATVSYSDGTITINGVAEGTATITVTGNNDGLTITKTIEVTVDGYAAKYTAAKAPYDTKVANLDAAGQAYWSANVTSSASVTNSSEYSAAVAALPTTYVAAVKAQTTGGSDMTDAMPSSWTCDQGNGPGTYATTFTETYSDGTNHAKFSAGNIMSQTITGLPNGYYKVQFYGVVNAANGVSTVSGSNLVQAYANSATLDIDVVLQNSCTPTDYLRTIEAQVIDGTLTYGLKAKEGVTDAGNWAVAKIYALTYLGSKKYDYTINAVAGGSTIKELAIGSEFPSDSYGVYIPKVIYNDTDSKYYVLDDDDNANLDGYYASYTMGTTDATKEINYTVDESIVVFLEAGSNIDQSTSGNKSYSSGNYGHVNGSKSINIGNIDAGIYQFEANFVSTGNRGLYLRDSSNSDKESNTIVKQPLDKTSTAAIVSKNFSLASSTTILLTGYTNDKAQYNQSAEFDYIIIRKLNVNADPVIVGDINYTTDKLGAMTEKVTLKPGESYHYQFVNHNSGSSSQSKNYVIPVYDASDNKILAVRADNWEEEKNTDAGCSSNFVWGDANATFISEMNGATVDMTIAYSTTNVLTMNATITTANYNWTYSYTTDYTNSDISLSGNIKVALSVYNSWAEVLSEGKTAVAITPANANSTYCSAYDLDFSGVDGLKAYIAASGKVDNSITLSSVDQIQARQGMVLVGSAGTTYIVPVTTGVAAPTTNHLVGVTENTDMTDKNVYILGTDGLFHPCNEGTLAAGKAYLDISSSGAKSLNIMFDNETLGINDATLLNKNAEGMGEKTIYNLSGQRIAAPQKGINIIGGRKVVVK